MLERAMPPVLELKDVSQIYWVRQGLFAPRRPLCALDDISLRLNKHEVLGVVGESGCGKSTLARILLGLLAPSAGDVLFDGLPMTNTSPRQRARIIQPVFQDPYSSLNPRQTIAKIISLPLAVHGIGTKLERSREVHRLLELVGLPARLHDTYPGQISGGQRQRVAIARALIAKPEIVICDEPTSALDVSVQSQILNLLMDLRESLGLTYLLISHNLAVIEHLATRVAVMYLGRVVEAAPAAQLFANPRHPYTQALLDSVLTPETGLGVPDTHLGCVFPNPLDLPTGCAFHPRCPKAMPECRCRRPETVRDADGRVECHLYSPTA